MEPGSCSVLLLDSQLPADHGLKRVLVPADEQPFVLQTPLVRRIPSPLPFADSRPLKRFVHSPSGTVSTGCSLTNLAVSPERNVSEGEDCPDKNGLSKENCNFQVLEELTQGSGIDWSWVHELDDFGKPCKSINDHDPAEMLETGSHETSSCRDGGNASENDCSSNGGCNDVSFKESFYSSGTDWSCLYNVDDYGMPYKCDDDCDNEVRKANRMRIGKVSGKPANEKVRGKLVQTSLSACWENKSGNTEKSIFSEGEAIESKLTAQPASKFWTRFKSTSALGSPVALGILPQSEAARRQRNAKALATQGRSCPFYKRIPGTSFTVDAFCYGSIHGCSAYFLTHFHSDHYGGLRKSWSHGPIYCTPVTARLLVLCLSVDNRWIYPVPFGITRVVEGVEVKLLEANHCPGAAIILFHLKNGQCILHTGDFRASQSMQSYPDLMESHINTLFLDTTYCNPKYRFPPQKEVIDFVVQITQAALKKNSRTLIVVGAYSIGKERVYLGIAEALRISIFVEKRRSRILGALEWPELADRLCADAENTILHVLPIGFLRPERLRTYLRQHPKFSSILAFRPTGWTYSEKIGNQLHLLKPVVSGPATIYGVPYSEHSSFTELRDFVQFLHPEKIIPTVNIGRPQDRDRMQSYFRQWLVKH